jgi:5-formyltetrahydrofolate cyclo-ligase
VSEFSDDFSTEAQRIKVELRAGLLAARRSRLSPADNSVVRTTLADLARGLPIVAGYVPLPGEPGGPELPGALAEVCGRLLLPVLLPDNDLDWAGYTGPLVAAARGMREPPGPRLGPAAVAGADLVIVPALAVDRRGVRLGRGGGSYDRALHRVGSGVLVVAVVFAEELVDELPEQPHDRRVDAVVTPSGLSRREIRPGE